MKNLSTFNNIEFSNQSNAIFVVNFQVMIFFPNAKINIGLNIVSRRNDGFHDIETVFLPVSGLCDILEIIPIPDQQEPVILTQSGLKVDGAPNDNLCVKAFNILKDQIELPKVSIHLHKQIPFGAGLGGGSSDGAFTLLALNKLSSTPLPRERLLELALQLGSDCPFFIYNTPCFATGRGENIEPIDLNLADYYILLVNPGIHINTGKAYSLSTPHPSKYKLTELLKKDLKEWNGLVVNDFEKVVLDLYPEIGLIKNKMYQMGAVYSAMSGSGSTVFGLFKNKPSYSEVFSDYYTFYQQLQTPL